ncbi:MAG: hypothetical protein R6W68_00360 [Ignavibacteriaceae bacterium]
MITEKDIYNYIFFPHLVDEEKKIIMTESADYAGLIDIYREIKSGSEKIPDHAIKNSLAAKIRLYDYNRFFRLKNVEGEKPKRKREFTILAAASEDEKPSVTAKSFLDEKNQYLIRIVKTNDKTKIYSFSANEQEIKNFKLTVLPSGKEFLMNDNSAPLEIDEDLMIEEVQLELI